MDKFVIKETKKKPDPHFAVHLPQVDKTKSRQMNSFYYTVYTKNAHYFYVLVNQLHGSQFNL